MSANLKERLLQTASELFYSQGIKATGVDAIVKSAGTTKMSLYKYFASKDDLVLAYLFKRGNELRALISQGIDSRTDKPEEKLLAVFDIFSDLSANHDFRGCPFINAAAEFAEIDSSIAKASGEFYQSFTVFLADLARQANVKDPERLSAQLVILLSGAMVNEQIFRNSVSLATARQAAVVLINSNLV